MSTLLEQASLVMIPSGYKEDVVYSQIPTDGSGDLAFTRASNGTRINSAGLVEVVPWNLLEQSETIGVSPWGVSGYTQTTNATTAPNGTNTAELFTLNNGNVAGPSYSILQALVLSGEITISVYFKNNNSTGKYVLQTGAGQGSEINVVTLAITNFAGCVGSVENVGNGWYRFSTFIPSASNPYFFSYQDGMTGDGSKGIYLWGAQVNFGTLKPYFPTTDRLNVPRLTYQNGGGGCPSLLLEKQSTNLITYSQDFTQWTIIRASLGANTTAPNGVNDGYSIIANTTNDDHFVLQDVSVVNTTVYSYTAFLKKGNKSWARLWNTSVGYADFDLENGVVGTQSSAVGSIQSFGNGWYRCSIVYTANSTGNNSHRIYTLNGDNSRIFAGDGSTINLYMFGAQLEESSYPTSYIPTTSSSATRVADGQLNLSTTQTLTNFTLFWDGVIFENVNNMFFGSGNSAWYVDIDGSTGRVVLDIPSRIYSGFNAGIATNQRFKLAIKRSAGVTDAFVNGTKLTPSYLITNTTSLTLSSICWGFSSTYYPKMKVNEICAFQSALSDAECQALTTL